MRKSILAIVLMFLLFSGLSAFTFTETLVETSPTVSDIQINRFFFKDYVPLRDTFEKLGFAVNWNNDMRMVEIVKGNDSIYIKPSDQYFLLNGRLIEADKEPIINSMRMQLPVDTLDLIFESVTQVDGSTLRVSSTIQPIGDKLPTLKNEEEYQKLLSFYPEQIEIMYMEDGVDLNFGVTEDAVMEESAMEMPEAKAADVSETNNQVDGVDESDIVKQDRDYIYALRDNTLQIIKTGRGQLEIKHTMRENGFYPNQLFIKDDKLILIGPEQSTSVKTIEEGNRIITVPVRNTNALMAKVYDMSDIENKKPTLIKSFGVEGYLVAARLVDDYVYIVANQFNHYGQPFMPITLEGSETVPMESTPVSFENVSYFPGHVNNNMLYTMGIDLDNLTLDGVDIDTYIGGGNTVYADRDNLYIALNSNSGMWWGNWEDRTDIFSFDLTMGKIDFKSQGSVPGYILNQFSMDEHNNHFRIATTKWGESEMTKEFTSLNNLYVLNDELEEVGAVEDLAPGERIYSTRMMGDKVYMVTYRQVDPFYVIDTTVPEKPKVLGYLKIPGYSSYLHPYDEKTIIGVGMETIDKGDRVVNDGVKISLFDVSNFNNPIEKDKVILGKGGSSTEVSYEHKAFLFNKTKNILALPARINMGDYMQASQDAFIFSFTDEGKLDFRGVISHTSIRSDEKRDYDYNNSITRIFYNGFDLYTLSNNHLLLNDFKSLKLIDHLER